MPIEMSWTGKKEAMLVSKTPPTTKVAFTDARFDIANDNAFISGDNLEVMKHLPLASIDLILTDPPYCTGGKDFVYNDRFGDDAWCSMMLPRMILAHKVLKPSGLIMVHIDKNQHHRLRMIMDEVFGIKNHLIDFVWGKKTGGGNDTTGGYTTHEFIVTYARERSEVQKLRVPLEEHQKKDYGNWDNDKRGVYKLESLKLRRGHYEPRQSRRYTITHPIDGREVTEKWCCLKGTFEKLWEEKRIYWPSGRVVPNKKIFLHEREAGGITPTSIINHAKLMTWGGRRDLIALGLAAPPVSGHQRLYFSFPKPVALARYFLQLVSEDATVLDIFAGSCSTAQAVIEANSEGGSRNFIMVQIPDPLDDDEPARKAGCQTIADVGRLRIDRVIEKINKQPTLFSGDGITYRNYRLEATDGEKA